MAKTTTLEKKNLWLGMVFVLAAGLLIGAFTHSITTTPVTPTAEKTFAEKNIDEQKAEVISEITVMKTKLKDEGKYACCLDESCNECLLDEGECDCAKRVAGGEHPCGECIGEILEGHGDPNLSKYFAKAIAHKVGEQHLEHLKAIIADMYGITVEEQVN